MNETLKVVEASALELLQQLEIEATVTTQESEGIVFVQIETQEAGILIGFHGRNLEALQLLLGQIILKKLGVWVKISVSVGDYRQKREAQLKEIALSAASRVEETQQPVVLAELSPSERRIVHLMLQDHPKVMSESEGEGRDRRLVVKVRA